MAAAGVDRPFVIRQGLNPNAERWTDVRHRTLVPCSVAALLSLPAIAHARVVGPLLFFVALRAGTVVNMALLLLLTRSMSLLIILFSLFYYRDWFVHPVVNRHLTSLRKCPDSPHLSLHSRFAHDR